jgi:hypothetical protein
MTNRRTRRNGLFINCTIVAIDIVTNVLRPMFAGLMALGEDGVINPVEAGFTPLPDIFTGIPNVVRRAYGPTQVEDLLKYYSEFCRKGVKAAQNNDGLEKEAVLDVIRASRVALDKVKVGEAFKYFLEYEGVKYLQEREVLVDDETTT